MQSAAANHMIYNHFFLTQKENISSQSFRINKSQSFWVWLAVIARNKNHSFWVWLTVIARNKSQSFLAQKKNVSALMRANQIFFIHQQQLDHKTTPTTVSHSHAFSIWSLILNFITLNFIQAIRKEWNLKSFILLSDYKSPHLHTKCFKYWYHLLQNIMFSMTVLRVDELEMRFLQFSVKVGLSSTISTHHDFSISETKKSND